MSTWCFADIHGQRKLFNQVMAEIKPDDTVYFLGDAIDRGPDGWEILKELLNDPRVIFIKGNHEDMMSNALIKYPKLPAWSSAMSQWSWNGYEPTIYAIEQANQDEVKEVLQKVRNLPTHTIYESPNGNIFWLCHAGCDYGIDMDYIANYDLIWDRSHYISNAWYDGPDNVYIVHGHTPIPSLVKELNRYHDDIPEATEGAYYYADGHKIDIDCGAHFTGKTVLLNLDTFEEKVFDNAERETN